MPIEIRHSSSFKRDFKKAKRQRKDVSKLNAALALLADGKPLPDLNRDHPLGGDLIGYRECHLEPDWLLVYRVTADCVKLARLGSHSELFD